MMKKLFAFIAVIGMLYIGVSNNAVAQDQTEETTTEAVQEATPAVDRKSVV